MNTSDNPLNKRPQEPHRIPKQKDKKAEVQDENTVDDTSNDPIMDRPL